MTTVSVLIPCFNPGRLIDAAIDSVLAQVTTAAVEIVVVDDGSTDGTPQRLRASYPQITMIEQPNAGTAAARNTALRHATGELVALLDQDDTWDPDKLARQLPVLDDATIGMVHAGGRFRDERGTITSVEYARESLSAHDLLAWCWIIQSTAVMRSDLLRSIGGFDERLSAADDWDLWIRLAAVARLGAIADPLVTVLVHAGNQSNDADRMYRSAAGVIAKHAHLHANCSDCARAAKRATLRNRQEYYRRLRQVSKQARAEGHPVRAAAATAAALRTHPGALFDTARHYLGRRARSG